MLEQQTAIQRNRKYIGKMLNCIYIAAINTATSLKK